MQNNLIPLPGRLIAELIPAGGERASGLIIINRKGISCKAEVLVVGKNAKDFYGKEEKITCKVGDTVYFKKYAAQIHSGAKEGLKRGKLTLYWNDIFCVETKEII